MRARETRILTTFIAKIHGLRGSKTLAGLLWGVDISAVGACPVARKRRSRRSSTWGIIATMVWRGTHALIARWEVVAAVIHRMGASAGLLIVAASLLRRRCTLHPRSLGLMVVPVVLGHGSFFRPGRCVRDAAFFEESLLFGLDSCFLGLYLLPLGIKTLCPGLQIPCSAEELKLPGARGLVVVARHDQPILEVSISAE